MLEWLVYKVADFSHLDANQLFIEYTEVNTMRYFRHMSRFFHIIKESDI